MNKVMLAWDCALLLFDGIAIWELRELLRDFLIGARNRKSMQKIHAQQSLWQRITLGYIFPYLKRYHRDFRFFRGLYLAELLSLLPQAPVLIWLQLSGYPSWKIVFYLFLGIKACLCLFLRLQQDAQRRTKYSR